MELSEALQGTLLAAALASVLVLALVAVAQGRALRRLRRRYSAAFAGTDATHVLDAVRQQADELDEVRAAMGAVSSRAAAAAADDDAGTEAPDDVPAVGGADAMTVVALPDAPPGPGDGALAVQRMAVVRYDAFPDMGASLSFSLALLDDQLDGLVVTSITGRAESRVYCKPVVDGHSDQSLSDEEMAAIDAAASGERVVFAATPRSKDERTRRTLRRRSA